MDPLKVETMKCTPVRFREENLMLNFPNLKVIASSSFCTPEKRIVMINNFVI